MFLICAQELKPHSPDPNNIQYDTISSVWCLQWSKLVFHSSMCLFELHCQGSALQHCMEPMTRGNVGIRENGTPADTSLSVIIALCFRCWQSLILCNSMAQMTSFKMAEAISQNIVTPNVNEDTLNLRLVSKSVSESNTGGYRFRRRNSDS